MCAHILPNALHGRKIQGPEIWPKGFTPKTRHLTKDLGTYSPREIHMRKPMSGRAERGTYAPILGFFL